MITTLSQPVTAQRKQESLEAQSLRRVVPFSQINLIDEKTIEYNGSRIGITKDAFKSLLRLIGMSQQFADKFEKLFNADAKATFINRMKNAMSSNSGNLNNVTMVLNPISKAVVHFTKDETLKISNEQFIGLAENMINDHSMDVTNWSTDPKTGIVTINAFNPKAEVAIKGLSDEVFTGGVTFRNSPIQGFQVMPYVNRQWCTNGLTTQFAQETYQLHSLSNDNVNEFFQHMQQLRADNFVSSEFGNRVRAAAATPASISEMQYAYNAIRSHAGERTDNWIPLSENLNAYNKAGFENLNPAQAKGAKSNQSVWSVINGLTHFATHGRKIMETNMEEHQAAQMMVQAGNILGRTSFDHENYMPNVFNELRNDGAMMN